MRAGADPARFYDDDWFFAATQRIVDGRAGDIYNTNTPVTALLLAPLVGLAPARARVAWTLLNLCFLGLALAVTLRATRGDRLAGALGLGLLALYQPVAQQLYHGQAYALVLLGEAAILWAYLARREALAGGVLGLLLIGKTAGLLLPLLLLAQRRWRALGALLLAVAAVGLGTLPWLGLAAWRVYAAELLRFRGRPEIAVTAYQDLPGLLAHLFRPDPRWNPTPLLDAPRLATALLLPLALALVAPTLLATWRADPAARRGRALPFAAWMCLTVILSPVSEGYHFTLLLVPIAILLADWREVRPAPGRAALTLLGVGLLAAPLPYQDPRLAAGAWALCAYPRLYGALILWALALLALRGASPRGGAGDPGEAAT